MKIAIDFGTTNTDLIIKKNNRYFFRSFPSVRKPSVNFLKEILKNINIDNIEYFAFTGGHHYLFKKRILNKIPISHINEIDAIGRGGYYLSNFYDTKSALVISAGTGTACVYGTNQYFKHITGTSFGGGTLIGLSKLLLNTIDPKKIDLMALKGNSKATDFILKEIVTGKIGSLKSNATAINFGKIGFKNNKIEKNDIAAGLMNLLAQSIIRSISHALSVKQVKNVIFVGRTVSLNSLKKLIIKDLSNKKLNVKFPRKNEFATAMGALIESERKNNLY